jgi:putative transposase
MDEAHLAAAARHVSLNPVRARLVDKAQDWRWSSVAAHLAGEDDAPVDVAPMLERCRAQECSGSSCTSYVYDPENRLVAVTGARQAQLRYDPFGRLHAVSGQTVLIPEQVAPAFRNDVAPAFRDLVAP